MRDKEGRHECRWNEEGSVECAGINLRRRAPGKTQTAGPPDWLPPVAAPEDQMPNLHEIIVKAHEGR
jgi:hypothetical protein